MRLLNERGTSEPPEGGTTNVGVWSWLIAFAMLLSACNRAPLSNPTALRSTNDYAKAVSPISRGSLNAKAFDQISITQEGESLVVTLPSSGGDDLNDGFEHVVKYLKTGEKLEGNGASFEVVALAATGPGISRTATNQEKAVPLDCFAPDGRRLSADELMAQGFRKWELSEQSIGSSGGVDYAFPKLRVSLGSIKRPPGYYSFVGLFDARTKKSLVNGSSYSGITTNQLGHVNVHPRIWHSTPIEMVLDVELDGKVVIETNAAAGMRVAVPGGEVKLLGVWDGSAYSWSSSSGGAGTQATLRMDLRLRAGETNAVALFVTEPPKLAVRIELLDDQGRELPGSGGGTSSGIRVVGLRGEATDVKRARFTVYTNHYRVLCELPPIPNLPVVGQPMANLFDVRIPDVQIQREYELRDIIGNMTEMTFAYPPFGDTMPTSLFPMHFTNVTASELLVEYDRYLTNSYRVIADDKKNEIRVEPTQFEKVKRWIQQWLP